jgi:hypothetical protein
MKPKINIPSLLLKIVGLGFYIYLFIVILNFRVETNNNVLLAGLYFVEFGVHELSHVLTMFLPLLYTAMAGVIGEVGFTIVLLTESLRNKSYIAAGFACQWIMLATSSAGRYIADARSQSLPLAGFTDNPIHDWHYVLGQLNALEMDATIGGIIRNIGIVIGAAGLLLTLSVIIKQIINKPPKNNETTQRLQEIYKY